MSEPRIEEEEGQHTLTSFLEERLPALGLDAETYTPYLLPLLTEEDKDEEEWEAVLELLQASSETHSDDTEAWQTLRVDCQTAWRNHQLVVVAQQQAAADAREAQLQAEREQVAQDLARQQQEKAITTTKVGSGGTTVVDEKAKQALVARYAYDMDEDATGGGTNKTDDDTPLTNKQIAAQAALEQARQLRGQAVTTKKDEQQKTAKAKQEKARLKEERRKRATKGERKR
jgi:hypothetical protein